jgi:hypothetical protein
MRAAGFKFKDPEVTRFVEEFLREQERTKREVLNAITANRSLLLYSPTAKVYEITVSDAGALVVTKVAG